MSHIDMHCPLQENDEMSIDSYLFDQYVQRNIRRQQPIVLRIGIYGFVYRYLPTDSTNRFRAIRTIGDRS